MIHDELKHFDRYSELFPSVYNYLTAGKHLNLEEGKHEIDENTYVLCNNYQSRIPENFVCENHHAYIDFQLVLKGSEIIHYGDLRKMKRTTEYDTENDYELFDSVHRHSSVVMNEMNFSVFYPGECHQPGLAVNDNPQYINKLVFKIKI